MTQYVIHCFKISEVSQKEDTNNYSGVYGNADVGDYQEIKIFAQ